MKVKRNILIIAVIFIFLILIIASIVLFNVYSFTLSNFIADKNSLSIYIPEGISDEYEGIAVFCPNEDHRVWKYKLKENEKTEINGELSNQIWQSISLEQLNYVNKVYFNELKLKFNSADDIYYCLYNCDTGIFLPIDDLNDYLLIYQHNILFAYNKTVGEYYCVNMETA